MSLIRHTAAQLVGLHKTKNMKNIKKHEAQVQNERIALHI